MLKLVSHDGVLDAGSLEMLPLLPSLTALDLEREWLDVLSATHFLVGSPRP